MRKSSYSVKKSRNTRERMLSFEFQNYNIERCAAISRPSPIIF